MPARQSPTRNRDLDAEAGLRSAQAAAGLFAELLERRRVLPEATPALPRHDPVARVDAASRDLTTAVQAAAEEISPEIAREVRERVEGASQAVRDAAARDRTAPWAVGHA